MYIKEITLDGFKSYAQRVTLTNFDKSFNAITGLNGSGKSNILDSICFVLGITQLQRVRVTNLQELVYKQGQAGINKATVSVTFHNDDPKTGPAGYEEKEYIVVTRQIVIGGRNKYLINGQAAQPGRVQDLFHSVQLNVNNPHFLIMQGMITKVLNMKPPEILSLLEEAAGTKLYEKKKDQSLRVLEKKQAKLEQIDQVMEQDLKPQLEKLEQQMQQHAEYSMLTANIEKLKRFMIAFDYWQNERYIETHTGSLEQQQAAIAELAEQRAAFEAAIAEADSDIQALRTEKELQASGQLKELQEQADGLSKRLAEDTTDWKNKKESLAAEKKNMEQVEASLEELNEAGLAARVEAATGARDAAKEALEAAQHSVEAAARELAGAEAGDGRDESNRSLQERLADAQNAASAAESEAKQAELRSKHLAKQASEQRKALASKSKEAQQWQQQLQQAERTVGDCKRKLEALEYDAEAMDQLAARRDHEGQEVRRCRDRVAELAAHTSGVNFRYSDPDRDFDRSKVKGVLAKLFKVKDPVHSTALEVAAGGKLYQVVVDSHVTGKALLQRGRLQQRTTFVPLDQVRYSELSAQQVAAARQLSGGRAWPALELIEYPPELEAAMKYAFGNVLVCQDGNIAKKLTFTREVAVRCVSLEGDDYNPGGLLTGGARNTSNPLLTRLIALHEAEQQLQQHEVALRQASQQLQASGAAAQQYKKLQQDLSLNERSLELLRERMQGSEAHQLGEALRATEQEAAAAQQALQEAQAKRKEMQELAKTLERDIASFSKDREKHIRAAQEKQKKAKAAVEAGKKGLRQAEQELQAALAEQEAAGGERQQLLLQLEAAKAAVAALQQEAEQLRQQVERVNTEYKSAQARLEEQRARLRECDKEISALQKQKDKSIKKAQECDVERRRAEAKMADTRADVNKAKMTVAELAKQHEWVQRDKHHFGKGDYDFSNVDADEVELRYHTALQRMDQLKGRVNKRAEQVYNSTKESLASLQEKRAVVEKDRAQIMTVIADLDHHKKEALKAIWSTVNKEFGNIFSTLLPGTMAKLEEPEGMTFLEGLEVRVAFGDVWKDSLTELSGGQRSLLALSLVLALCKYKPAPIYILDEVDAALDLNHTQNIGAMIRQNFPQSQFIVVSLKEGLFNNANVIFRTKFVDGVSQVLRTENSSRRENGGKGGPGRGAAGRQALRENVAA